MARHGRRSPIGSAEMSPDSHMPHMRLVPDSAPGPDPAPERRAWERSATTRVLHAIGQAPSPVAAAPVIAALESRAGFDQIVVHAGNPEDWAYAGAMLEQLGCPEPDRRVQMPTASLGCRTAHALMYFERLLIELDPGVVIVTGTGPGTLACALAAAKAGVPVASLEAGLRCGDWRLPEEVDRVLIDRVADLLLVGSADAEERLVAEGVNPTAIHTIGSTLIDALRRCTADIRARRAWEDHDVPEYGYVLVALRRGDAMLEPARQARLADALTTLAAHAPVVLAVDRGVRDRLIADGVVARLQRAGVRCHGPSNYLTLLSLESGAGAIVTDSGSVEEEASAFGVECYSLRAATERIVTLTGGTNRLLGEDPGEIAGIRPSERPPTPAAIPLWDGRAAERVADALLANYALRAASEAFA
jgi:UDP-N-acetylglucosamine 2-epimerase (non-hydrolysing)